MYVNMFAHAHCLVQELQVNGAVCFGPTRGNIPVTLEQVRNIGTGT
jgi:hypothetical protein